MGSLAAAMVDAAGEIVAVGPGVSRVQVGQRVCNLFMPEWFEGEVNDAKAKSAMAGYVDGVLAEYVVLPETGVVTTPEHLSDEDLLSLGKLYSQIIDFRSSFTATHSSGVSAVAAALADLMRFSTQECLHMRLAGYLHDIGKLIVPESILEKDGPLTPEEFEIIRSHSYYSDRLLMNIKEFDTIRTWGALHHERLNGKGYPFRMSGDQLPLGSRIMAVADVFVALSEDRPYRAGMEKSAALAVLDSMTKAGTLDGKIVQVLVGGFDQINDQRLEAQNNARLEYSSFYTAASA